MTAGMTKLLICQRALADAGTRSTITQTDLNTATLGPPVNNTEAYHCNLFYDGVRNHILRAANWNFAKKTTKLQTWKALPGTPENPNPATLSGWTIAYPAPPWVYSYLVPADSLRPRVMIGQPQQVPIAPPIFSGSQGTNPPISQRLPMARFEVASDSYDQAGQALGLTYGFQNPVTIVSGGVNYRPGDYVVLDGGNAGVPGVLLVQAITGSGAPLPIVTTGGIPIVTTQGGIITTSPTQFTVGGAVTFATIVNPGTYTLPPSGNINQVSTTGSGSGLIITATAVNNPAGLPVILTNQEFALLDYTFEAVNEFLWDAMFEETMIAALAARLARPLTGDKVLSRDMYMLANDHIINARVADGNEGLTINDHMPDWLRTRGAGGGLGYEQFFYPLGPLFPIAPLV